MTPGSLEAMIDLFQRSYPDIIVLALPGGTREVNDFVDDLRSHGIQYDRTPTFALVDSAMVPALTGLLEKGIEDIIPNDGNLDMLVVKIQKIQSALQSKARERQPAEDQVRQRDGHVHVLLAKGRR